MVLWLISRFSFRWNLLTFCSLLVLLALPFCGRMPVSWGYENGLLENLQVLALFYGVILCLAAEEERGFYRCVALALVVLLLREISCGRTLFCAVPGEENAFYKWKDIPYGWVVQLAYRLLILWTAVCFFRKKRYRFFWQLWKQYAFPLWPGCLLLLASAMVAYAERVLEEPLLEENAELAAYLAAMSILSQYIRHQLPQAGA